MNDTLIKQLENALTDAVNNEMSMKQACSHFDLMGIITGLKKKTEMHYATREALEGQVKQLKREAEGTPAEKANLGCATTGELLYEIRARLALIDKLNYRTADYRTADWVDEDKPKKKAEFVATGHVIRRLRELARDLDSRDMSLLGVFTNLKILIANLEDSGMCGPKVESQRIVIERAEAKPPEPTVSECAETISKAIQEVVTHMDSNNPYDSRFIRELGEVLALEEMSDLLNNPALAQPRDKLHQTINLLAYLCHDLHYDLLITWPYANQRWHVTVTLEGGDIESRTSANLSNAVKGLYDWLVEDCNTGKQTTIRDKHKLDIIAADKKTPHR